MTRTLLHTPSLDPAPRELLHAALPGEAESRPGFHLWHSRTALSRAAAEALRLRLPFDLNPLPPDFDGSRFRLVATDMDSTLIRIECIDEMADYCGIKDQVARITEAASRGEIDFAESLRRRVALFRGASIDILERVHAERLELTEGATELAAGLRRRGVAFGLVSGGFTEFTDRLQRRLALDFSAANRLGVDANGRLDGSVAEPILDSVAKAEILAQWCTSLGTDPAHAIAVGDGANDLPMLARAGLGIAFRAKPRVRAAADAVLQHSGLDAILHFLECPCP